MIFNSIEFAVFFPIVFIVYWFVLNRNLKFQNIFLVAASYFFYGWWDWRFLSLIIFSSLVDFFIGIKLGETTDQKKRKILMLVSVFTNLGFLGVFKYYNFFIENFTQAFSFLGTSFEAARLDIILPVGISFYTFQTLSYSLDIYKKKFEPTKDIVAFFAYVSFFPQLVAGPIERASHLLPQFFKQRQFVFKDANEGVRQILLGFFKKVAIADNFAVYVDQIFSNPEAYSADTLILGAVLFAIQLYGDFSGYSDIAIGTARLLGFDLMQNFATPHFSLNITEFWRRWHISLSTWFRDYMFQPLMIRYRNLGASSTYYVTLFSFTLIGIWHGANWTFIIFGFLQGFVMCIEFATRKRRKKIRKSGKGLWLYNGLSWFGTMAFWVFSLMIFRSPSIQFVGEYLKHIIVPTGEYSLIYQSFNLRSLPFYLLFVNFFLLTFLEWLNRKESYGLKQISKFRLVNILLYLYFFDRIINNITSEQPFVYFQF